MCPLKSAGMFSRCFWTCLIWRVASQILTANVPKVKMMNSAKKTVEERDEVIELKIIG